MLGHNSFSYLMAFDGLPCHCVNDFCSEDWTQVAPAIYPGDSG